MLSAALGVADLLHETALLHENVSESESEIETTTLTSNTSELARATALVARREKDRTGLGEAVNATAIDGTQNAETCAERSEEETT